MLPFIPCNVGPANVTPIIALEAKSGRLCSIYLGILVAVAAEQGVAFWGWHPLAGLAISCERMGKNGLPACKVCEGDVALSSTSRIW
jgi:hypothetical protein